MQTSIGGIAVWLLSACFAVGLLLVLPISMVVQRRAGEPLPGPTLPNWFARLVNALIIVVIAIMLFFFAGLVMWVITS